MQWFLAIGIFLVAFPIVAFITVGTFMLHASLKDDGDGMKVLLGIGLSVLIGGVFLATYAGAKFLV